jgi:peroxiredoxin
MWNEPEMRGQRFYLGVIGLVALNLIVLSLIWHTYRARSEQQDSHPRHLVYGERSPTATAHSITGQEVGLPQPSEYTIILFFDPHRAHGPDTRLIKYANVLYDRYRQQGLNCVTIAHSRGEELSEWASVHKLSYPLVADERGDLHERFLFSQEAGGTLIVDTDGVVRFSYHALVDPDLLRQLTEKFLLGQVNVALSRVDPTVFQPGRQFPEIETLDLRKGVPVRLNPAMMRQRTVVVFTADCASCQLNHYISQIKLEQGGSLQSRSPGTMALFSRSFAELEVLTQLRAEGISSPVYLATEDIPGLEDPYNTRYDVTGPGPLVVHTNRSGRIISTAPIEKVLREDKDAIH